VRTGATPPREPTSTAPGPADAQPVTLGDGGVAFLGCGAAAAMHASTLARLDPGRACFFASRSGDRARRFSERHGGAGWFAGYESALLDDRVEVAVVVTPPSRHLEWTLAALEAGKHVIVEKPAFPALADFDRVREAARRSERRVLVAENYAYKPIVDELRWVFEEEPLGRVLFLQVNAVKRQRVDGWRADPAHAGGGALFEGGVHWISLLAHLGPEVTAVRALEARGISSDVSTDAGGAGAERSMQVLLRYEQGTVASLAHSWEVPSPLKGMRFSRIYGTRGSAVFESNGALFATLGRPWRVRLVTNDLLGYQAMFGDFLDALRSGIPPRFTLDDARRDVELVLGAYRDAGLEPGSMVDEPAERTEGGGDG
jgi:UDP-N-acetylglucosamine 3-dehydrogenase